MAMRPGNAPCQGNLVVSKPPDLLNDHFEISAMEKVNSIIFIFSYFFIFLVFAAMVSLLVWSVKCELLFSFSVFWFFAFSFLFFSFLFLNRIEFMTSLHDNDPFMFHVSLHFLLQRIKVIKWKANNLGGLVVLIWLLMRNKNYETQFKFQCALK